MKIIFLDIDGVLNIRSNISSNDVDAKCLRNLELVIKATGAKIVISSTWRLYPKSMKFLEGHLSSVEIWSEVIGVTPQVSIYGARGREIIRWLDQNQNKEIEKFAVIDDDFSAENAVDRNKQPWFYGQFFPTTMKDGLTVEIANKIIDYLN